MGIGLRELSLVGSRTPAVSVVGVIKPVSSEAYLRRRGRHDWLSRGMSQSCPELHELMRLAALIPRGRNGGGLRFPVRFLFAEDPVGGFGQMPGPGAPGVGPVTATAFVATVDDVRRFRGAHQVEAYLGLVPREWSSSEIQRRGHITTSPKRGIAVCAGCSSRRRGALCAGGREWRPRRCAPGRMGLRAGVAGLSPWWRWRAVWPGFSLRSGGTGVSMTGPKCGDRCRHAGPPKRVRGGAE
jgi:hypothetical protein